MNMAEKYHRTHDLRKTCISFINLYANSTVHASHHMSKQLKLSFLRAARAIGVFKAFRYLTRSKLRILCYHGGAIGDESDYNGKLFLSKKTFEQRIKWLNDTGFNVVSLDDAVQGATGNRALPSLATTITFDDGWYSTGSELIPVLKRFAMPSTLYLCTSHMLEGTPVADVTVRYIIWKSPLKAISLHGYGVAVDGNYDLTTTKSREQLGRSVAAWIESFGSEERAAVDALERFAAKMQVSASELHIGSRRFQYLTPEELRALPTQGCAVELHGHVHHYPNGDPAALKNDLRLCSDAIQGLGLPLPTHYCYPSGNFDAGAAEILGQLGVASATTCIPGLISEAGNQQAYFLPRFLDGRDVEMLEFEAEMSGVSDFLRRMTGRAASPA